jgi:predicted amidohydrolase
LHEDEFPFFIPGENELIVSIYDNKIAPAICYESLLPEHSAKAAKRGADIYMSSVAKSAHGMSKAYNHYPEIARVHSMIVAMSNCIGICDGFESVGQSAFWNKKGELTGQLNEKEQGILIMNTETEEVLKKVYEDPHAEAKTSLQQNN